MRHGQRRRAGRGRRGRGAELTSARDRALRPALDAAVEVGRSTLAARPPGKVPSGLKPVLRFARLSSQALASVERAVDGDDAFRAAVVEAVDESSIGRPAWLWLARPPGWEPELEAMTSELDRADEEADAVRAAGELRRTVAALEAAVAKAERDRADAADELAEVRAELARQAEARSDAEREAGHLQREVERLAEERSLAMRRMKEHEAADAAGRGERKKLKARVRELEAELAGGREGRRSVVPEVADEPAPPWDAGALARAVADATRASADLARALDAAAAELEARGAEPASGPAKAGRPERGKKRPARRRPARIPALLVDNTPEALHHLLRLPECVLVVDGYNISMAAWPGTPITEQRQRLVDAMRELHARLKVEVVVVFDGSSSGRRAPGAAGREVRVLFTGADEIADDRIVALLDELPASRPVVVVTSDRELQERARAGGANVASAKPFLAVLGR